MDANLKAKDWGLPPIANVQALATWLALDPPDLAWFADLRAWNQRTPHEALRHYRYHVIVKRHGTLRLIEAPKPRLKAIQHQILTQLLDLIPAHAAAHGFVRARSIATFAAPHQRQQTVLRLDLDNFFPRLGLARIQAYFRTLGYPRPVSRLLGGLCTNRTPRAVWHTAPEPRTAWPISQLYAAPHLPQGAPSSPSLANACAYRFDGRLSALAQASGVHYTRYADDLAFSGDEKFARGALRFAAHAAVILAEEGFCVNHHKTRLMRQGVRQHLTGLVVNQRLNVGRDDFDLLKATLTNCVRLGPESKNRENHPNFQAHLEGRVGFVAWVNHGKGERLKQILGQIHWPA